MTFAELAANEAVVSAVIGAVLGSVSSHIGSEWLQRRRDQKVAQHQIQGEIALFIHDYLATLMDILHTRLSSNEPRAGGEKLPHAARLSRLQGQRHQLESRLWQVVARRFVRATFHRLLNRLGAAADLVMNDEPPTIVDFGVALHWIEEQRAEFAQQLCDAVGMTTKDGGGIAFVGIGPRREERLRLLSFDDEPPPWKRKAG